MIDRNLSVLVLIDVQEKLTPLVLKSQELVEKCDWLIRLAADLSIPLLITEQYPRGLGHTITQLQSTSTAAPTIEKIHFSCYRDPLFVTTWKKIGKKQAVLAGIESHVCVLQTALDMKQAGWDVFVVVNAISSRHEIDHQYALTRMTQAGIHLVTTEMVFFEWVGQAGTPEFKQLSLAYLR